MHSGQIRTLRGGQAAAANAAEGSAAWIQNVIRGKGKPTNGATATVSTPAVASSPAVSRQNSLFVDQLNLRGLGASKIDSNHDATGGDPGTPNSTGSATSTARALFSRLLGQS